MERDYVFSLKMSLKFRHFLDIPYALIVLFSNFFLKFAIGDDMDSAEYSNSNSDSHSRETSFGDVPSFKESKEDTSDDCVPPSDDGIDGGKIFLGLLFGALLLFNLIYFGRRCLMNRDENLLPIHDIGDEYPQHCPPEVFD
ncbi:unnamed protein product [Cyprideis torosa]|uniref:Uncharacterized protein n=1 Tax=Cyprideis torosa TaxID=163714 RepID=A0A7R8W9P2_9CRUS|nr:unnamed protein product [Cyprideis torosa]CAG0885070.1 unnamed protein product [Cyprideis torosa]